MICLVLPRQNTQDALDQILADTASTKLLCDALRQQLSPKSDGEHGPSKEGRTDVLTLESTLTCRECQASDSPFNRACRSDRLLWMSAAELSDGELRQACSTLQPWQEVSLTWLPEGQGPGLTTGLVLPR